jgi:bifunctional UDP-N-acetylglucosamine pyrophosphorylase/glucosamine-1-phosphate N-acetyltransferase
MLSFKWKIYTCYSTAQQLKPHGISSINPSSTIHPTAIVGKDVIVGKNVKIGPYCYIRDNVILDDDVFLGYGIEISNSVILCGTQIHHSAFIGNSVIGEDCNLGAWFVTSTRRLDSKDNVIKVEEKTIKSMRRHHGAILGDGVEVGVLVCTMPGATVGHSSIIFPNSILSDEISPNSQGYFIPKWAISSFQNRYFYKFKKND